MEWSGDCDSGRSWPVCRTHGSTAQLSMSPRLIAGYSFNRFRGPESVSARDSFVTKAEAQIWRDLTPRIGILGSIGDLYARPEVSLGIVNADAIRAQLGIAYAVFLESGTSSQPCTDMATTRAVLLVCSEQPNGTRARTPGGCWASLKEILWPFCSSRLTAPRTGGRHVPVVRQNVVMALRCCSAATLDGISTCLN